MWAIPFRSREGSKIPKWEICITSALAVIAVAVLTLFFIRVTETKHLDSVFLFEASQSAVTSGIPTSRSLATLPRAFETFAMQPEEVCKLPLLGDAPPYNVLENHAYIALYPIGLLAWTFGSEVAFAFLNAVAHVALMVIPIIFLRRWGVGRMESITLAAIIAFYPGVAYSAVGDYYLDRLAMPLLLLFVLLVHDMMYSRSAQVDGVVSTGLHRIGWILVPAVLASICTERAAIMVISTCLFYLVFFPSIRRDRVILWSLLTLVFVDVLYLYLYFKCIHVSGSAVGDLMVGLKTTLRNPWLRLSNPLLYPFIAVNFLFLGAIIPFASIRYVILSVGAMIPNILISVGGAELFRWDTHYHAMYVPFLIATAAIGWARISLIDSDILVRKFRLRIVPIMAIAGLVVVVATLDPFTGRFGEISQNQARFGVWGKAGAYFLQPQMSNIRVVSEDLRTLSRLIPIGTRVSVVEGATPALFHDRSLSFFPFGIDAADFIVTTGSIAADGVITFTGAISFLGPAQAETLNRGLLERVTKNGFRLQHQIPSVGLLILSRGEGVTEVPESILP